MDYVEFLEKLKSEDSRIEFSIVNEPRNCNSITIPEFYQIVDPINVEFEYNDGIVRLVPFEELILVNLEYRYVDSGCIFATCNGTPIYEKNKKVFTCICGSNRVIEEEIAISIDSFFEQVNDSL